MSATKFAILIFAAVIQIGSYKSGWAAPFTQPPGYTGGQWETGSGPDRLEIEVSNTPSNGCCNDIAIRVTPEGGTPIVVAAPVRVHSLAGMTFKGDDIYIFHGTFGDRPKVDFLPVAPGGISGLWVNNVSVNYNPLVTNSCNDSRGSCSVNSASIFNSAGTVITFGPAVAARAMAPGIPASPQQRAQSVISGAIINGRAHEPDTLTNLINATPAQGNLILPPGTFTATASIPNPITIGGAGMGRTVIDGTGIQPVFDKGGLVPMTSGVVIRDLTIRNFKISEALGGNAAGVRDNGDGVGFTLTRVELDHNQNGILTYNSSITLIEDNFHDNGSGTGYTHNFYVNGTPATVLAITNSQSAAPVGGHAAKSRAGTTNIIGGLFSAGGDGAALDVPDGGLVNIDGATLVQPGTGETHNVLTFAMESAKNASTGLVVRAKGMKIVDPMGVAIIACGNGGSLALVGNDNVYEGPKAGPDIKGCMVTGTFSKALN